MFCFFLSAWKRFLCVCVTEDYQKNLHQKHVLKYLCLNFSHTSTVSSFLSCARTDECVFIRSTSSEIHLSKMAVWTKRTKHRCGKRTLPSHPVENTSSYTQTAHYAAISLFSRNEWLNGYIAVGSVIMSCLFICCEINKHGMRCRNSSSRVSVAAVQIQEFYHHQRDVLKRSDKLSNSEKLP